MQQYFYKLLVFVKWNLFSSQKFVIIIYTVH